MDETIILVGDRLIINDKLNALAPNHPKISIEHAPEVVEMWDKPVESAKAKPNNSMTIGIGLLKTGKGEAFVTAGNTGGVMFNAMRILGRIKGVQRPALTATFPTLKGKCIVIDVGANSDCRPDFLVQFGIMGSIYAQNVLGIANPKIGLLSNGEEAGKGNQLVRDAYKLFEHSGLNFYGNIEPKELFAGEADVIVADGFTGNIMMKIGEAVAKLVTTVLKDELMRSARTKLGALLVKPAFSKIRSLVDPSEIGAAPLLGVDGLVFVTHGHSNARAIVNSLLLAEKAIKNNLLASIKEKIAEQLT